MKTIILVRHAKSSWKDPSLDDFDRPLNKRGKKNAPFMGKKLREQQVMPDVVLSSPAKRAKKTAIAIAKAIGYPKKQIIFDDNLYHAGVRYIFELVKNLDDAYETIMLFGHNPGINQFADMSVKRNRVDNIPTTGIYCVRFDVNQWQKLKEGKGECVFFDYPKRYKDVSV